MTENTVTTDKIVCPNCGYQHTKWDDYDLEYGEIICNECRSKYSFNTAKTIIYTTKPLPETKKYVLELPEPMREMPKSGDKYWLADAGEPSGVMFSEWVDAPAEKRWFEYGMLFKTEAAAQAFIDALKNRQPATE